MPLYEYHCENCQKLIEMLQKFSDPPLATCPDCGKPVTKIVSRTSFQLKGTGWYATDYKKSSAPASPTPETPTASTSAPEKAPVGDSKPAEKKGTGEKV